MGISLWDKVGLEKWGRTLAFELWDTTPPMRSLTSQEWSNRITEVFGMGPPWYTVPLTAARIASH